ncbi:acyl-CoA synthetase [Nocardia sp. alder85J]|uniref:acyl-CoA synthetase n=1 Tax=Nocardia sp. alder85J TaxID=2862949 RepID=UPI001CD60385|nr:acyl-CoA synthetase [Nocardia sp. alder85J]MCX4096815.1 acyl-CoA synthetase [Nocardia sp. alder85J]
MLYPGTYADRTPARIAAVLADTGETLTYGELEDRSVRLANTLRAAGLRPGDCVALLTENNLRAFEVYWAALRSGFYITAINRSLTPPETAYIVDDSGAAALIVSGATPEITATAETLATMTPGVRLRLAFDGPVAGYDSYEDTLAAASPVRPDDQPHGMPMLYSSGTTGFPKGVQPPLPPYRIGDVRGEPMLRMVNASFGIDENTVYLSPAPIYHAAPLRWSACVQGHGGTVVMLRRFDAAAVLAAIAKYRVTHGQFVPTMLVRLLQLPGEVRAAADVSSLRCAIHAAAPCPVEVKQRMIDWWGPILTEYYSNTEGTCMTMVDSADWLKHPGTVGRSIIGTLHVCDDTGAELPPGQVGALYGERDTVPFVYHNDPGKSAAAQHPDHPTWTTAGDVGYLDEDGFLYLTDRKAFTIISGGVNIYPQEIENALTLHPAIHDIAVIGLPHADLGEAVTAFVQPAAGVTPGPELAEQILDFARERIARFKMPRAVHFVDELPRTETGKLIKRELRQRYAPQS